MGILSTILIILLILTSIFLICLILIQRGKGGGLAGAFGGAGGSSAFGTKAGDVFTRITIGVAGVWILLNMMLVVVSNNRQAGAFADMESSASEEPGGEAGSSKVRDLDTDSTGKAAGPVATPPAPVEAPKDASLPPAFPDETPAKTP